MKTKTAKRLFVTLVFMEEASLKSQMATLLSGSYEGKRL